MINNEYTFDGRVRFYLLPAGKEFIFEGQKFLKVSGPADREECYAINLKTYRLTYFSPSEPGISLE